MRVLILGGSWFLGREIAEQAVAAGYDVTAFRRGQTGADAEGVSIVRGDRTDREDLSRLAAAGPWDAVIDTSSYVPRETFAVAQALKAVTNRYVLVSTVSVYQGWPTEPLTEDSLVLECPPDAGPDFGYDADPGPTRYGFGKAGCEHAVEQVFGPDRVAILRPGVILGPREYVGRVEWWLQRLQRGGHVLAPGRPERPIQPVDVRDVAAFALIPDMVGVFNLTAGRSDTMGDLLEACRLVTGSTAVLEWVTDEGWLAAQGIKQWTELPLWRTYKGTWAVDSTRAQAAGFAARPIQGTVAATWAWLNAGGSSIAHERAGELGISGPREEAILGLWHAYQSARYGAQ